MTGKQIPASDFNAGALDIFSDYVWPDVLREHASRQASFDIPGFEGDIYYKKNRPIEVPKSYEQRHLMRGDVPCYIPTEEAKLALVRHQLAMETRK